MKIVLDTNVLVAAFIAHGTCHDVLEACVYDHELLVSDFILEELHRVLSGKFGYARREIREVIELLRPQLTLVEPCPLDAPTCADPDDDLVLGTALAGACQCLITGDRELLALTPYKGVDIIAPHDFWRYISRTR